MPPEANDRELLRQTFNTAAAQYQEARPEYPGELYVALIALAGLRPEADTLCEVGAGPGKATIPLARRGFRITCVELGAALAGEARRNLAGFSRVTARCSRLCRIVSWYPRSLRSPPSTPAAISGPCRTV